MELIPIDLGNGVLLFKNVLKNPQKTYEFILNSKTGDDPYFNKNTWTTWLPWGNYSKVYPNQEESYKTSNSYGAELQKECLEIFFNVLKIYKEQFLDDKYFEKYNWDKNIPTSLEEMEKRIKSGDDKHIMADMPLFETSLNADSKYQMRIHQDVVHWWGGGEHMFNFNIYINDDYEGGEILFFKHDGVQKTKYIDAYSGKESEAWMVEDYFVYKMKAGDGLIFPTDYYHGVLPLSGDKTKFYIRQFLSSPSRTKYYEYEKEYKDKFVDFFESERVIAYEKRIMPILFDSLDKIDLDDPKHLNMGNNKVACVVKTKVDLESKIN